MKKKVANKSLKSTTPKRQSSHHLWVWIIVAFLVGGGIGYITHYVIVNWSGFFALCPDGNRPDKNGCCSGEIYTDAGDGWMVCCPDGAMDCFPPMK